MDGKINRDGDCWQASRVAQLSNCCRIYSLQRNEVLIGVFHMQFGVNHQPEPALGHSLELKREEKKILAEVLRTLVFFT